MKLDYDCIRYILLSVEASDDNRLIASSLANDKYDVKNIIYHVECLLDVNYLDVSKPIQELDVAYNDYFIYRITMFGHQFLDTIRDNSIWSKTKSTAKEVGATTLKSILTIAENIISTVIASKF